jgi:hypothetical protein
MSEQQERIEREIPLGNAGVEQSIALMLAMARTPDERVSHQAMAIWEQAALVDILDAWVMGSLIHEFLLERLRYQLDADDIEEVRSPGWMLAQIEHFGTAQGDCDDYVTLAAALCLALGLRCRFRVVSQTDSREYDHVYLKIWTGDRWTASDAIHGQPYGWEVDPASVSAAAEFDV